MGKQLSEYKAKVIEIAVQLSQKNSSNIFYSADSLTEKLKGKLEPTGDAERDVANCLYIIGEMIRDAGRGY